MEKKKEIVCQFYVKVVSRFNSEDIVPVTGRDGHYSFDDAMYQLHHKLDQALNEFCAASLYSYVSRWLCVDLSEGKESGVVKDDDGHWLVKWAVVLDTELKNIPDISEDTAMQTRWFRTNMKQAAGKVELKIGATFPYQGRTYKVTAYSHTGNWFEAITVDTHPAPFFRKYFQRNVLGALEKEFLALKGAIDFEPSPI